ncbi:rod-binding protein [Roseovarius ramblicola]|uniref:Rod-binding protein n=1 Tax=Roseovarius ramblicola TaxID=2022336 RepID=A0ABV5HVS2_9RHOB
MLVSLSRSVADAGIPAPSAPPGPSDPSAARRDAAEALEASFLAEMLRATGLGEQENSLSGSTGESQFASFHRAAIAREMVAAGGIGLADVIEAAIGETSRDGA